MAWATVLSANARAQAPDVSFAFVPAADIQPGGPTHDFRISKFEIRNDQFISFLNNARGNLDNERGAFLRFDTTTGAVFVHTAELGIEGPGGSGTLVFDPALNQGVCWNGTTYVIAPGRATHPVTGVTWFGAVKYCNWLTLHVGLSPDDRAYAEAADANISGWRPVTIEAADWAQRDLNTSERLALRAVLGFRLPMDGGENGGSPSPCNEWFKSAAWDAVAGVNRTYGFGRDAIAGPDANYRCSGDPFEDPFDCIQGGTAPVGFYDGTDHGGIYATNADTNPYGLFAISGNVWEWVQDQGLFPGDRRNRGGSFRSSSATLAAAVVAQRSAGSTSDATGFRVVQSVPKPLLVTPFVSLDVSGVWGGPYDIAPPEKRYVVRNLTNADVAMNVTADKDWLDIAMTPVDGIVPAGTAAEVVLTIIPECDDSFELGVNESTVTFFENGGEAITERAATLTLSEPLAVTPIEPFESEVILGGTPQPPNHVFTIASTSDVNVPWSATWQETNVMQTGLPWLLLDGAESSSGVVPAGGSWPVVATIDSAVAGTLAVGQYTAEITIVNECTGEEFQRSVELHVIIPFDVAPVDSVMSSGPADGPFAPPSHSFILTNPTSEFVTWSAAVCDPTSGEDECLPPAENWLTLDTSSGVLSPQATNDVLATIDVNEVPSGTGTYDLILRFSAPPSDFSVDRTITVEVSGLRVEPVEEASFIGHLGGPFTPAGKAYTLLNETELELEWDVSIAQDPLPPPLDALVWLQAQPSAGVILEPQDNATITVSLTPDAVVLPEGQYSAAITFTADGETATRMATLTVGSEGFDLPMSMVPGADVQLGGPAHDFRIGRFEVTNAQFARFLNDAWRNRTAPRGQFMYHDTDSGSVFINDATNGSQGTSAPSATLNTLLYNAGAGRINVDAAEDDPYEVEQGFEEHPVVGVSWYGAVKFCNWLTLVQGMPPASRCYTEGTDPSQWASVSTDLAELIALPGFRLPMDDFADSESTGNEWFKVASRAGVDADGDAVFGAAYGFGRDTLTNADANFLASGDTQAEGNTPVGFFNGVNLLLDESLTAPTGNGYGLYDLCGNAAEWVHETDDAGVALLGAVRGGHYNLPPVTGTLRTDARSEIAAASAFGFLGFRVAQSVSPIPLVALVPEGQDRVEGPVGGPYDGEAFLAQLSNPAPYTHDEYALSLSSLGAWLEFDGLPPRQVPPAATTDVPLRLSELVDGLGVSPDPIVIPMALVPHRDQQAGGPDYDYWIGTTEVTNEEFAVFLNDALARANEEEPDAKSDHMYFDTDSGDVYVNDARLAVAGSAAPSEDVTLLMYDASVGRIQFVGTVYQIQPGFADHPVVGVTWYGAVKYCNWLTVHSGLPEAMRAYAEGVSAADWRPASVAAADWSMRDATDEERRSMIRRTIGFRLPMDNGANNADPSIGQVELFNEWHKASSRRIGPDGLAAFDAVYGFGRDVLTMSDANYFESGDTPADGTTPVGLFDGVNGLADGETDTSASENGYGLHGLSGNVAEWVQDCFTDGPDCDRAVRGGGWRDADPVALENTSRVAMAPGTGADDIGFRVVHGTGFVGTITIDDGIAGQTMTQHVLLDLQEPLAVLPLSDLEPAPGTICGEFSGTSTSYRIQNISDDAMPWSVTVDQDWVTIAGAPEGELSGEVAPGDAGEVSEDIIDVATNSLANELPPGAHTANILFRNTRTNQSFSRQVRLMIDQILGVQAAAETIQFEDLWQGAFEALPPVSISLARCTQPGCDLPCPLEFQMSVEYETAPAAEWLVVTPELNGPTALPAVGESFDFDLAIAADASAFLPETYRASLVVTLIDPDNGPLANPLRRDVELDVRDPIAVQLQPGFVDEEWDIGCEVDLSSIPPRGYALTNHRLTDEIGVTAEVNVPWIDVTPETLSLLPGATADVELVLNESAPQSPGAFPITFTIHDTLTGFDHTKEISVKISDDFCVTPLRGLDVYGRPDGTLFSNAGLFTASFAADAIGGPASWSITSDQPWIQVFGDTQGSLAAGQQVLITVAVDETVLPPIPAGQTEATFGALVSFSAQPGDVLITRPVHLTLVQPKFETQEAAVVPEIAQPSGPNHPFVMSQFHVTNAEFVAFLNDAVARPNSERGKYMFLHTTTGDVYVNNAITGSASADIGNRTTLLFSPLVSGQIAFASAAMPPFSVLAAPIDFTNHPVTGVSWYGAVKFCNWLTLDQGLPALQRSYGEGTDANLTSWRPKNVEPSTWALRDLIDIERAELSAAFRGYRLPMDDGSTNSNPATDAADAFNEWFMAAAWQAGQGNMTYGFGANPDPLTGAYANFRCSGDPYEGVADCLIGGTTPVGFFDGVNILADGVTPTIASQNAFGLFDMSGNAFQWMQGRYDDDTNGINSRAVRGGGYNSPPTAIESRSRNWAPPGLVHPEIGIRVVRTLESANGDANYDGVIDGIDAATLASNCLTGPNAGMVAGCGAFDLQGDADVDLRDAALLFNEFGTSP